MTEWTQFLEVEHPPINEARLRAIAERTGKPYVEVLAVAKERRENSLLLRNNKYQVILSKVLSPGEGWPDLLHLSIKRLDNEPVRDWRDLQQIKNEIVGPKCEAMELFPSEERLVDSANQFHLWCSLDPDWRVPFGFEERLVVSDVTGTGCNQREIADAE